jgi:uncharacterized protein
MGASPMAVAETVFRFEGETILKSEEVAAARSGHKAVRVGNDNSAWIEARRCGDCGATMVGPTMACRSCGSADRLETYRAAQTGRVFSWTVVHRSYPGIPVPFVSAIVDLDGGPTLKGTLRNIDPAVVRAGMPVHLVFDDAGGARDAQGTPYVGFHFLPGAVSQ